MMNRNSEVSDDAERDNCNVARGKFSYQSAGEFGRRASDVH